MNIGTVIRENRTQNNLSQKELAEILNIDSSEIEDWESNKKIPEEILIKNIIDLFDIDENQIESTIEDCKIIPNETFYEILKDSNKTFYEILKDKEQQNFYGYKKDGSLKAKPGRKKGGKNKVKSDKENIKNTSSNPILKVKKRKVNEKVVENQIKRGKSIAELTRLGYSPAQIAEKLKISRQRVSQLIIKAINNGEIVVIRKTATTERLYKDKKNVVLVNKVSPDSIVTKKCIVCDKTFTPENPRRKTCSKECFLDLKRTGGEWSRHQFIELQCNNCGKTFKRSNYLNSIVRHGDKLKYKKNDYCSRECYINKNKKYFECVVCGEKFNRKKKTLTCSKECLNFYRLINSSNV